MNNSSERRPVCPVCAADSFGAFKLGLFECMGCGVIISPLVWQSEANKAMEDRWFGEDYQVTASSYVRCFESWNNRRTLARLAHAYKGGGRLLEVGVGSGSFLDAARAAGFDVMGCDLSASICRRVSLDFGIAMHSEPLAMLSGEGRFNVIVMNHVVEHVNAPIEFLNEVFRLLVPGGVAHIAVPNIDCWQAVLSGWTSYEPYHLVYFSPHTLKRTVIAAGLAAQSLMTHDSFSGGFLAVLRTVLGVNREGGAVARPADSPAGCASGRRPMFIEHAYRLAMIAAGVGTWPLRVLQARRGRGDEIICIARKPATDSAG